MHQNTALKQLQSQLEGELYFDDLMRKLYATDASVYRMLPLAVALPKSIEDLKKLILFAPKHKVSLVPRTAGTSLAGQCVGEGIIVDTSKYFTRILAFAIFCSNISSLSHAQNTGFCPSDPDEPIIRKSNGTTAPQ